MTSREQILANVKANQPALHPLPEQFRFTSVFPDIVQQFMDILAFVGGKAERVSDYEAIKKHIQEYYPGMTNVATTIPELASLADTTLAVTDPHDLASLNLAIIEGQLAVAENGAIWLDERQLPQRVTPMITQYLAIVIRESTLVPNMHDAYQRITVNTTGFGTFLSGPSKTADIEQSLVIGAHGARSLIVYMLP
ncbi:LUD domain-containing protein [Spirosoma sp. BT702]|uniref:LUD domain-containing protein n=1 Tax=Spirosoma profusum TaxID=2771354 RepID=A0A926XV57_9BACT|nr:LUD domain-containing protein [Spirosoma profusum]MBD2700405.1 LUD domain-containing protein [Spirosoma profusum]